MRGHPAFVRDGEDSLVPLLARIARDPAPSLADAGVPPAVREVVERTMAKDPADRPASAADLRDELRRVRATAGAAQDTAQHTTLLGPDALAPPRIATRPMTATPAASGASASATSLRTRGSPAVPEAPGGEPGGSGPPSPPDTKKTRILVGLLAIGTVAVLVVIGLLAERRDPDRTGTASRASESATNGVLEADEASELLDPAGTALAGDGATPVPGLDYDEYVSLSDDDGIVTVDMPAAWSEVETASGQIVAGERLSGFYYSYTDSGASVNVSSSADTDPDRLLDETQEADCASVERSDYDDGVLTGRFDTWIACGADGTTVVVHLAAVPHDNSDVMVTASLQLTEERDFLAAERFLRSLVVNSSAL
jgi:hypothetical protein